MGESVETSPWLSLWESWLGKAETERVNVDDLGGRSHSNNAARPSQSRLCRASSPKGRAKGTFLRIRPLLPQCFTLYRISLISLARGASQLPPGEAFVPCFWVVPFNPTGCIRDVAGGKVAAPTCTRVGGTIQPYGLYSGRSGQGCRPYMHVGKWYRPTARGISGMCYRSAQTKWPQTAAGETLERVYSRDFLRIS